MSRYALFHAVPPLSSPFRKSLQQSDTDVCARQLDAGMDEQLQRFVREHPDTLPVLREVSGLLTPGNPVWIGTATELAEALRTDMKPNALAMRLNIRADALFEKFRVRYESGRSHAGRRIRLTLTPEAA